MATVIESNLKLVAENDSGYGQLFAVLLRRRIWLLGTFILTVGIAAFATSLQEPTYISAMQLLVEPPYQARKGSTQSDSQYSDPNVEVDSATQINLMRSSSLLRRAMGLLQADYPEFDPDSPTDVKLFRSSLSINQITSPNDKKLNTKIFQAFYTDNDPTKTRRVLEAIQKVYTDYNREQQQQRLSRGLEFINQQLPRVEDKLRRSEASLEKFRNSQEVINPEEEAKVLTDSLSTLEAEQRQAQAQAQEIRSRYTDLQRQINLSPQDAVLASRLSQSERYQTLLNEIQKTDLALVQQRVRFTDKSPYVQQLTEQRQTQFNLLRNEVKSILGNESLASRSSDRLLAKGQLGALDVTLISQFIDAKINLQATEARTQSLALMEQRIRAELKRFPALLAEYGRLQPEVELTRDTLKQLLRAQQDLALEITRGYDWQIVEEPQQGIKTGPNLIQNLLLGAVAGLMLGGVAAFLRDAMDDAVHSSDDLQKQTSIPLLGVVPQLSLKELANQPLLNLSLKPQTATPSISQVVQWQPFRESLDLIYQNMQLLSLHHPIKSLVITSALTGEGKSTLAMGLAVSAARLHQRVLLVDADLRRPSLHELFNLPNDRGLSTLLTSKTPIPGQIQTHDADLRSNISVLTSGPTPTDPAKLLSSPRMREIMSTFEQTYDLVLLDAPPVLGMVDAILAASCCNGVLMVGRVEQLTRADLAQASAMLSKLNVIGVVANGSTASRRGRPILPQPSPSLS